MAAKKRTIHLVYTVPMGTNIVRRAIDKLIAKTGIIPPLHRYGIDWLIPWRKPLRSPHAHSRRLLHAFKKYGRVRFYSIYEKGIINLGPDDIFFGQPVPAGGFGLGERPVTDDHDSITSRTLRKYKDSNHNKFLFTPFANDPLLVTWLTDLISYSDKLILIGGEIWTRDWSATPFKDVLLEKVMRVDNAVDPTDYYFIKKNFNPPGERKFLYIGHVAWYKNTIELERIAEQMPGFIGKHIGGGTIKGWENQSFANFTPEFLKKLGEEYDFFINTSSGDAQATTILENMSFGFPVACTPESGYTIPSLITLDMHDTARNIETLTRLQNMDESELRKIVAENLKTIKEQYSYEIFLEKIINFMKLDHS